MSLITFSDLYNAAINRCAQDTSDSTLVGYVKDWLNFRYKEVCSWARWPWLQDNQTIRMIAEYTTGTVDCTTLTTSVTGSSTVWTKAMTGRKFKFDDFDETYRIAQWSSVTGITLANIYNGDTVDDGTYTIFQDEYLCPITWGEIKNIRDLRNGNKLDFMALNVLRAENPNSYPEDSDPEQYSILETRDVTRIDIDTASGTFQVDEMVSGGTSSAYGIIKKVASSYLYIQILYGTFTDGETITGATSGATTTVDEPNGYTEGNIGGVLKVIFNPAPYRNILYDCEIIKKPVDLSEDTDEPLVPEEYRDSIFYLTVADIYDSLKDPQNRDRWEAKGQSRVLQMINRYRHQMGNPRIRSAYPRIKYV
jgi:hypothetical protein